MTTNLDDFRKGKELYVSFSGNDSFKIDEDYSIYGVDNLIIIRQSKKLPIVQYVEFEDANKRCEVFDFISSHMFDVNNWKHKVVGQFGYLIFVDNSYEFRVDVLMGNIAGKISSKLGHLNSYRPIHKKDIKSIQRVNNDHAGVSFLIITTKDGRVTNFINTPEKILQKYKSLVEIVYGKQEDNKDYTINKIQSEFIDFDQKWDGKEPWLG